MCFYPGIQEKMKSNGISVKEKKDDRDISKIFSWHVFKGREETIERKEV